MMSKKTKKLISNLATFALGNLGSKLISFILIPIFTRYMSTSEFGHVDIITTTVNMLLPMVALSVSEAVFRFVMDKRFKSNEVLSTGLLFTLVMIVVTLVLYPLLYWLGVKYVGYLLIYLSLALIQSLFQNFIRGVGYVKEFAVNGLLGSFVLALVGVYRIVFQHAGIVGYLDALLASTIFSVLFLFFVTKLWRFLSISLANKKLLRKMLLYSIPLIPNSFLCFFTNDANRYFIVGFVGLAANGIYAVANKIPTIINVLYTVFSQAWQISAVEEYESNRNSKFFSNVFNANISLSVILIGGILIVLKPLMAVFVASDYFVAWKIVPALLFATFFSNLSSFLGTIYLATEKTRGIMKTTIYGMIANIIFNSVLIPTLKLQGAGIGAAAGFAFIALIRLFDVRKFIFLQVAWKDLCMSLILLSGMSGLQYLFRTNSSLLYGSLILCELLLLLVNIKSLCRIRKSVKD
ncbi:oligosaccharide flippase family protein [Levilactobacillus brevis]|nr:oligosaccharide flippase family protein [Levilactobacillus brevis]